MINKVNLEARTTTYNLLDICTEYMYLLTASLDKDFDFDMFMDNLWREETDTSGSGASVSVTDVQCLSAAATVMDNHHNHQCYNNTPNHIYYTNHNNHFCNHF